MPLMTIGYEGASLEDFLKTLEAADVSLIADIRELPISRKRGFAKTRLSKALEERGIGYIHLRALGDPKSGREAARNGNFDLFREIFTKHLKTEEARIALTELQRIADSQLVCLLCYERDPKHCHRSIVAERIQRRVSTSVKHLGVPKGIANRHEYLRKAA